MVQVKKKTPRTPKFQVLSKPIINPVLYTWFTPEPKMHSYSLFERYHKAKSISFFFILTYVVEKCLLQQSIQKQLSFFNSYMHMSRDKYSYKSQ